MAQHFLVRYWLVHYWLVHYWSYLAIGALGVLLVSQQARIAQIRRAARQREEMFRIVAENATDMIALVDVKGRRLYNSPSYKRTLGYSPAELSESLAFEQIHPDDRFRVLGAAREAQDTGVGKKLEYRIRHKDGSWRVFESVASTVRGERGEVAKLLIVNRDVTERKRLEEQMAQDAFRDAATGLPNRQLFLDRLGHLFGQSQRDPHHLYSALLIDLEMCDGEGKGTDKNPGDPVWKEAGTRLSASLRETDFVARPNREAGPGGASAPDTVLSRFSGNQFAVLLEATGEPSDALRVARRLQEILTRPFAHEETRLEAHIGIAVSNPAHRHAEDILREADIAMRRAKSLGGAHCELFDEAGHALAVNRLQLEADLRTAVAEHQFRLFYQPVVSLASRKIVGLEALLRWEHPRHGMVSPYRFLRIAENLGLMVALGRWTISESCRQLRQWQRQNRSRAELWVTVNLSARQLADPQLIETLQSSLQESGTPAASLRLEISESTAHLDPERTIDVLSRARQLGVHWTLDDFAAGPFSLALLRRLPVDSLKIDGALVHEMMADRGAGDIVELAVMLALKLNLKVIGESIENTKQFERLRALGCEWGQGFLFSPPVAAEAVEALLAQSHATETTAAAGSR